VKRGKGKRESRREHNPIKARSEEAAELAAMLAPPEEKPEGAVDSSAAAAARRNGGAIVVDTDRLKLPKEFLESGVEGKTLGLEPVVAFILCIVLAFIGFIAYLIYIEPPR
jgi:hypothetical protein